MTGSEGHHLAGAIDGEGCFAIIKRPKGNAYVCSFNLALRADDEQFVRLLRSWTGDLGITYRCERNESESVKHHRNSRPVFFWRIDGQSECSKMCDILDMYRLRSKKERDYIVWREAVEAWATHDWPRMAVLHDLIRKTREYDAPELVIPDNPQLRLVSDG